MHWKIHNHKGEFILPVNCVNDAIEIAKLMYDAKIVELDLKKKIATIKEYNNKREG